MKFEISYLLGAVTTEKKFYISCIQLVKRRLIVFSCLNLTTMLESQKLQERGHLDIEGEGGR